MLDKSIPFHSIIMKCKNDKAVECHPLPEGFSVRYYQPGDEKAWANIQCAVLEFEHIEDALRCFEHYLDHIEALKQQQIYIIDDQLNKAVATATAWFTVKDGQKIGVVNGLSCLPEYQSLGLGRITAEHMMASFYRISPNTEVWLDTQTWSYKAIGIYLALGFVPMRTATYSDVPNEFDAAIEVMKEKMRPDVLCQFMSCAE